MTIGVRGRSMVRFAAAAVGLLAAMAAALAWATGTATIGSDMKPKPNDAYGCGGGCVGVQTKLDGEKVKAPFDGAITKWKVRKGPAGDGQEYNVRLWVLRPAGGGSWEFIRRTPREQIEATADTYKFSADLRIDKGDRIGLQMPDKLLFGLIRQVKGDTTGLYFDAVPDKGDVVSPLADNGFELYLNATIVRD